MQPVALNWSSGKDAALAYYYLQQDKDYEVTLLLTSLSEQYKRVSMHGVPERVLELQAQCMGVPLKKIWLPEQADMPAYNRIMSEAVSAVRQDGITHMAFGDIFLEDLRQYREAQLKAAGMNVIFPLWKKDTATLVREVEDTGIRAMIVCVNEQFLGKEFLGRYINRALLNDLPATVDPCGENGEFHTLVVDAPYFKQALPVSKGEVVHKKYRLDDAGDAGFFFLDILAGS